MTGVITSATITTALTQLAERPKISPDNLIDYATGYPSLVKLFGRLDLSSEAGIYAGAYAAYGWMPTTLKKLPTSEQMKRLVQLLEWARTGQLNIADWAHSLQAINGSIVGTSKFLHFAAPSVFPMWDRYVASSLGISISSYRSVDRYCQYFHAAHEWLAKNALPSPIAQVINAASLTPIRKVELALFWEGQHRLG